jgi:pimeloyl-ACP methyl ester carboxylesterase
MTGGEKTEWTLSRRFLLGASVTSVAGLIASQRASPASIVKDDPNLPYGSGTLPPEIRARTVRDVNGLNVNVLESGFQDSGRSLVLLLHGFPELAYGWRKVMLPLAAAGYHVVAPDQRGYGRTTGWDDAYDTDLSKFSLLNLTRDALALVSALGYSSVSAVVGHDAGSPVAAWCSLIRPDIFRSVVLMAVPFTGPPMSRSIVMTSATMTPERQFQTSRSRRSSLH